jgi:hypothetical protein
VLPGECGAILPDASGRGNYDFLGGNRANLIQNTGVRSFAFAMIKQEFYLAQRLILFFHVGLFVEMPKLGAVIRLTVKVTNKL